MDINVAYRLFIDDRTVYCSPDTLSFYKSYLKRFISWLDISDTDELNKYVLREYIVFLRDRMKNTSVRTNYRSVKAFCKWLFEEDYINVDVTIGVKLPRSDAAIVEPLSDEEVNLIDRAIINNYNSLRNYCIFHLMLDCGLRRKEVVNLRFCDVKQDRLIIHNSKGNKDRIVLLPKFLYMSICNYYATTNNSDSNNLFLDRSNNMPITNDTIRKLFVTLKRLSCVDRVHAHLCRHTFATSFLQYGGNMEKLRLFMGHSDYEILKNYLHLSLVYPNVYRIDDIFFNS